MKRRALELKESTEKEGNGWKKNLDVVQKTARKNTPAR